MSAITSPKKARKASKSGPAAQATRPSCPSEAPDRGLDREAPESGRVRIAEAPDAGEGRQVFIEGEFTHGRSQS